MTFFFKTVYFNHKEVEFHYIDDNCSTMRNNIAWRQINSVDLMDHCQFHSTQRVLMCYRYGYYKIAIVHTTYPTLDIAYYKINYTEFNQFWQSVSVVPNCHVNWIKEGF
jgi:hypothetical protein